MAAVRFRRQQLERHVICDGVTLEPRGKGFLKRGVSLDDERIPIDPDENIGTKFAFRVKEESGHGLAH